ALVAGGGQDDDRDRRPAADAVDHLGAVHVRQPQVQDDHVGPVAGHGGQPGAAVDGGADVVLARAEVDPQRAQDGRLVVDDEHPGHGPAGRGAPCPEPRGPGPRGTDRSAPAAGSVPRTVSPPPGVSNAPIRPPIASAKPRATASPSPTPGCRSPTRSNGSKMRSFSSSGTPGPWSTTSS